MAVAGLELLYEREYLGTKRFKHQVVPRDPFLLIEMIHIQPQSQAHWED